MLSGCVVFGATIPPDVQRAINRDDMRRLETSELVVYYPEGTRPRALAAATRLEYCRRELAKLTEIKTGFATDKTVVVLPRLPFNNAFVLPTFGGHEQFMVLPEYNTSELFVLLGILPDPSSIGCHEMVHDQSFRQLSGAAKVIRYLFGNVYSPQLGLESWWQEGLAVYYETKLQGSGRLWTPYFQGVFAAGLSEVGSLHGGYLDPAQREVLFGGNYLFGAHFVDYLARTYGEDRLWRVIGEQSNAVFFPFAISNVFRSAYGKSLATLIDEFAADAKQRYPARARPAQQRALEALGQSTKYARSASGREVLVTEDVDDPPRLVARAADGRLLASRRLTDLGLGRRLISPSVEMLSGLSLTRDGRYAYFVALDQGAVFSQSKLLRLDLEHDELEVVHDDLAGPGGSISGDGRYYYFARSTAAADAAGYALLRFDTTSGEIRALAQPGPRQYLLAPVASPDGRRLLVTEASDAGIRLALYDAANGQRLGDVAAPPGHAMQGSWVDDERIVYAGSEPARMQIFETDLRTQRFRRLSDAPYLASLPYSNGQSLRFLNRDGWRWTLDEIAHPASVTAEPAPPAPAPIALAAASDPGEPFARGQQRAIDERPPDVLSDEPYSIFDHLFLPSAWAPWITLHEEDHWALGAVVTGGDRLGKQRWAIGGAWDIEAKQPTVSLSYLNAMLAPAYLQLNAAYIGRVEDTLDDLIPEPAEPIRIEERLGTALIGASWYGSFDAAIGGRYNQARYELESNGELYRDLRFTGPLVSLGFRSVEYTAYAGKRLGFGLDGTATYFPDAGSSVDYDLTDVLGRAELILPLPLSRRHTLTLDGRARALLGTPPGQNLLQVGGSGTDVLPLLRDEEPTDEGGAGLLPPGVRFFETLRGFEDLSLFGRRALIGDATYTYPFIIDWGSASTLKLLPALFLRQINLDLFFASASFLESGREVAMAAGASLDLRVDLWSLPLSLELQGARRLTYDEEYAVYFTLQPVLD